MNDKNEANLPTTIEGLAQHQARLEAEHRTTVVSLEAARIKAAEVRRPLDQMICQRQAVKEGIKNAEILRAKHVAMNREFEDLASAHFGTDSDVNTMTHVVKQLPQGPLSERAIALIDKWLPAERAKLAELDKQISADATKLGLEYLVPADIGR